MKIKNLHALFVALLFSSFAFGQLSEGFETWPPADWTIIQGACSPTNDITQSSTEAYTGTYSLRFSSISSCGSGYDEYLISPQLSTTSGDQTISFWYKRYSSGTETFMVGWSSTGTNISTDFTWSAEISNASTTWQQYSKTDLPIGTKYVAIHYYSNYQWYLYIDDFAGPALGGILNPGSFAAVAASTSEIDVDWTQNASNDNVMVAWSSDGVFGTPVDGSAYAADDAIAGGGTVLYNGSALHYDHIGLTENTQYYYNAWSVDGSINYSSGIADDATTPCVAISTLPFLEGFNSASTTQSCWTVLDVNGDGDEWNMDYTSNPYEGDQVAMMYTDFNSGVNDDYLISPAITLTGNERLKFWQRVQSSGEPNDFEVLLSTTGIAPADFTNTILPSASYSNTTYEEIIIDISAYTGIVYIAWRVAPGGLDGWRLYIDAVTVEDIPACPEPIDLISSNVTSSGADLGWTSSATLFHVKYNPDADFDPETEGTMVSPDPITNSCTLGSLTSNTTYYWYVQTDCGTDEVSPWVGSTFQTLCSSVTSFSENFDAVTTPALPDCWSKVGTLGSVYTQTTNPNTSPNCVYIYSTSGTSQAVLSLPPLSNAGAGTHWLKFQARANYTVGGIIEVGYLTDPLDANTFVSVQPVTITSLTYAEYITDLGTAPGSNNYLALRHSGVPANSILIDDVVWEAKPTTPLFSISPATKDFGSAVAGGSPTAAQTFTISNVGAGTLTITAGGITLAGADASHFTLTDGNTYPINLTLGQTATVDVAFAPTTAGTKSANLQVAHNAPGSPSTAALTGDALPEGSLFESFEGTTFPPAGWATDASTWTSSSTSYDGAKSAYNYDAAAITDEKLITPLVSVTGGDELTFYARNSSGSDESLQIRYSTDKLAWSDIGAAIVLTSTWTPYTIDLTTIAGADYYLAFGATSAGTYNYFYVDYVMGPIISPELPGPATIGAPANAAIDVSANTTLTWSPPTTGGIPDGYKLYFGTDGSGTVPPTTIENGTTQTSPYTPASALAYSTTYYWQVVPYNVIGDATGCPIWSFTTMADPTLTPPVSQDFAGTFPPLNYTRYSGLLAAPSVLTTTTSGWTQDDWRNVTSPVEKAARLNIYGTSCRYWLMTPPIDLGGSGGYQLEFDLTLNAYGSSNPPALTGTDDRFAVIISTDNGVTWTSANTLRLWDNAGSSFVYNDINTLGETIIIDLASYTGIVKIGFYGESTVTNADNDLMIDNLKVRVPPLCLAPQSLTATNITSTAATLGWTEMGSATQWNIVVGAPGFDPDLGPYAYSVTSSCGDPCTYIQNIPNNTLSSGTTYQWYIRADCGSGNVSEWSIAGSFKTIFAAPYCEDFTAGYPPVEWTEAAAKPPAGTTSTWSQDGFGNVGTTGSARVEIWSTSTDEWMFTPAIDLGTGSFDLEFDLALTDYANSNVPESIGDDDLFEVHISTDGGVNWTLLQAWTNLTTPAFGDISTTGEKITISLSSYSGIVKIGFYGESTVSNADNDLFVDNVCIFDPTAPPLCTTPNNPMDGTTDVSAFGALSWNTVIGATSYKLYLGTDNPPTNLVNGTDLGDVTTYDYSGLAFTTEHFWQIVPTNTNGDATGCDIWSFTTITPINVNGCEYFDGVTEPTLPAGWTALVNSTSSFAEVITENLYSNSAPNSVEFYNSADATAELLLVSPPFDAAFDLTTKQVTFMGRGSTSGYTIEIGSLSDPTDETTFTLLGSVTLDVASFVSHTVYLAGINGIDNYLAFRHGLGGTYRSIYIDDVCIEDGPSCYPVLDLAVTGVTSTSADLGWTDIGGATTWEIEYGLSPYTFTGTASFSTTDNPHTLSGLGPNMSYDWNVRANCGGGDFSDWSEVNTFTTLPDPHSLPMYEDFEVGFSYFDNSIGNTTAWTLNTTLFNQGAQSAYNAYGASNSNILHETGILDLSGSASPILQFAQIAKTEGNYDHCIIEVSIDGGQTYLPLPIETYTGNGNYHIPTANSPYDICFDEDSYSQWGTGSEIPDNTWWKTETFDLNSYKTTNVRFRFRLDSDGSVQRNGWYLDDIYVGEPTTLSLNVFLEGPYDLGTGSTMFTDLNTAGYIPLNQPYDSNPSAVWYYTGTESVAAVPSGVVDWVVVQLRDAVNAASASSATIITTKAAFLLSDGSVVDIDGTSPLRFNKIWINDGLFAVVYHRNHLGIMSANALTESGGVYSYNFSTGETQVYGGLAGHKDLGAGIWGMIAADGDANGTVQLGDKNGTWLTDFGSSGYLGGDFDMNGVGQLTDKNVQWLNNLGTGGQIPAKGFEYFYKSQIPK